MKSTRLKNFWRLLVDAIRGVQVDVTEVPLSRAVVLLATPMIIEMMMESTFFLCDIFFVTRLGHEAAAVVGLTESVLTILYAVAVGLSMSTTALVARRIGEKNKKAASEAAVQAILCGLAVSFVVSVLGVVFGADILRLMGGSPSLIEQGTNYTRIMFGTNAVIMLLFINNSIFRGAADAAIAMRVLIVSNSINIVLDPLLIFGIGPFPELGLTGAAIATSIGRFTGVMLQFYFLQSGRSRIRLLDLKPKFEVMIHLLKISAGGIGQFLIATSSWIFMVRILATFGDVAVAGYTIALRVLMFIILPVFGVSNAAATIVGQNLGAKKPERAEKSVWMIGIGNTFFMAAVTIGFLFGNEWIVSFFVSEGPVYQFAADALRIIGYGFVFYGWELVLIQAFNGSGDTGTPTWINFFCFWLFQVPAAYLLAHTFEVGPDGVCWAVAVSYSVAAGVAMILFRQGKWKLKEV